MAKLGLGDIQGVLDGSVQSTAADIIAMQKNIIPRLTTTQRDALTGASLYNGLLIFNTTTNKLNVKGAAAWEVITSA